jgi:NodT family efflux transporter outer membrane factor (OMF) lipoprotein
MRPIHVFAASLLSALASPWAIGCAVKQPPPAGNALKEVLPSTTAIPAAWKEAGGGSAGTVATDWIRSFGDQQLEALVEEGLQNNLDLKAAATRIDVAAAIVVQARSLLYPQLAAIGGAGAVGRDSTKDRSGLMGEVSWELDLWGRVRSEGASAQAARQATEADLLYARQSLAATVATLWYETIATERLRQTAEEAAAINEQLLGLVKTRNVVGQVGQQDLALAAADLDRARYRERAFATTEQQVVRGLEVIVGRYPAAEIAVAPDLPPVPPPIPEGLPSDLLTRRPDIVAAERRLVAAFHLIQAAEAARLPRIALTAAGGRSTSELLRLANVGAGFWRVGLDIIAPIFTGGALQAQVAIATADQREALALYGQTALRAFSEVETSLAGEQLLSDQQRFLESVLAQDTEALRLGRLRFDAGAEDLLHVLQLQARQLNTQFELIAVRNDRLGNRVALHLALGGGFAPSPIP